MTTETTPTRALDLPGVVSAWRSTFESISDGVVLLGAEGRIVTLNRAAANLLQTDASTADGARLRDILDLPDLDDPQLLRSPDRVAFDATTGDRWLRLAFDPMTDGGRREGTVVTISDVTDRKRVDLALANALRQQQQQSRELARASAAEQAFRQLLEAVVDEMPVGVVVADAMSNRPIIVNGEMARILRREIDDPAQVVEAIVGHAFHDDGRMYRDDEWPLARSVAAGETVRDEELEIERGDGTRGTISVSAMPIRAAEGSIVAAVATVSDITRRREAEALRDAFIGVLSHELRTPITSIYGGSKILLRDGEISSDLQRGVLEDLAGESERLNRMVENLLVLARVERGVTMTGGEPVLLQRLLPRIVADEARQWSPVKLQLEVPNDLPTVAGDESFIDQVLRNYISNACKYGPTDGTVQICVRPSDGGHEIEVTVVDEGEGIEEAEAPRLFELFFRSSAVANKTSGSGIGLFVSRHLVEGMGGRVWARRGATGGSEFGFSLPLYEV